MLIYIAQSVLNKHAFGVQIAIIITILRCIHWHKHIRNDTATTIDRSTRFQCSVFQRIGHMDTIGMHQFAIFIAVIHIFCVIFFITKLIRLLNTTTRWCVVTSCSETHHRPIFKSELALNQSLSECTTTHNYSSIPVLYSSCHNFTCRC